MKPYYEDSMVTLYCGDCRDILPTLVADAIVTDPPYGVGVEYDGFTDTADNIGSLAHEVIPLFRASTPVSVVFTGVKNMRRWPDSDWTLCWFMPNGIGVGPWGFCTWQPILAYGKDPFGGSGSRPDGLALAVAARDAVPGHPCPKPVGVMGWLIRRVTKDGGVILDPFAGSGSTLVAAKQLGYRAIGIELSERYCDIIISRMAQGSLFEVA